MHTSSIIPKQANALITLIRVSHDTDVVVSLQAGNMYGLPIKAGTQKNAVWLQRQSNKWVHPTAVLTECDADSLNVATIKVFEYNESTGDIGALYNSTATALWCMWLARDADAEPQLHESRGDPFVTMGRCERYSACLFDRFLKRS